MNELEKLGCMESKLKHQLYPTSEYLPYFYGLPKIHRGNIPRRPIVCCIGAATYDMAKLLAFILRPLVDYAKHNFQYAIDFAKK